MNKISIKNILLFFYTLIFVTISSASFSQTILVGWDFDDGDNIADSGIPANNTKTIIPETTEGRSIAGASYVTGASGLAVELTSWDNGIFSGTTPKYWVVEFDATGYANLRLSSKQSSDSKGPADFRAEYSTDGSTWIALAGSDIAITVDDDWTNGVITNILLPSSLDHQSSVFIRWVMTSNLTFDGKAVNNSGKSRIDDIVIQGDLIPTNSDIIPQNGYSYSQLADYVNYSALNLATYSNGRGVFGLTILDGGITAATDGLPTTLTSMTFSTNGSNSIRAAALFDDTNTLIAQKIVNGANEFTIDNFDFLTPDGASNDIELRVSFEDGVLDNEQIVFTVTNAIANPAGTAFNDPDAGGAQSSNSGTNNTIRVYADQLNFVQVPTSTIPVDEDFTIEVEAVDSKNSRDLDYYLSIYHVLGNGNLSTPTGILRNTTNGTAVWNDLSYDTEEDGIRFQIYDGGSYGLQTDILSAKYTFTIFTFTGAGGYEPSFPPDRQPSYVTISDISRGPNISASPESNAFSARNWPNPSGSGFDANSYYQVTVSAENGYNFNLSSIMLDHRSLANGPSKWEVRSSIDNYSSSLDGDFSTNTDGEWNLDSLVDFGTTIQNQTSVTLRIYAYDATDGNGTWAIDNLKIFGKAQDVQDPSFTAMYPNYDSARYDGFHVYASVDEPVTAYYLVKSNPSSIPTDPDDVINGTGGVANGSIIITTADSAYREIITGLNLATGYDVYWVLDDGNRPPSINAITQLNVRTSDDLSSVSDPATQIQSATITGTADSAREAVDVFTFTINDDPTTVGLDKSPTNVSKLWIKNPQPSSDWSTIIGGVTLSGQTLGSIPIINTSITTDSIVIDIDPVNLIIPDLGSEEVTLGIFLQSGGVIDGTILQFEIDTGNPGEQFMGSTYGSQFPASYVTGPIQSNVHTIDIKAKQLNIDSYDPLAVAVNERITLVVSATDENGNMDLDYPGTGEDPNVTIMLGQSIGGGTLDTDPTGGLTQLLVGGTTSWNNIIYNTNDIITLITTSPTLDSDTTGQIIIGGGPQDLIVNSDFTLSINLSVRNVTINDGATLTLASGITLGISGNFTFNGTGTLNDLGATTLFNGGSNLTQIISKSTSNTAERFYNIEVNQGNNSNAFVINEMSLELINTLTITRGKFDANGVLDDRSFTLLSTADNTARIAPIPTGPVFDGEITMQRRVLPGTPGWRLISTPIKNQTLASWSDDFSVQGVTGGTYPGASPIVFYYDETMGSGTTGADGWVPFTNITDNISSTGIRVYFFASQLTPDLILDNTGPPVIGDYTINVDFTSTGFDGGGWNLVENPYPCEIDFESIISSGGLVNVNNGVHIWNPTIGSSGNYGSYVGGVSTNDVTQYVASGQSFFVKANNTEASISYTEDDKVTTQGNTFIRKGIIENVLKIKIASSDQLNFDETAIRYKKGSSEKFESEYDAYKLANGWINISSLTNEDLDLSINTVEDIKQAKSVRLRIAAWAFGDYTMNFTGLESFIEEVQFRLVDKYLDETWIVDAGSEYTFQILKDIPETYGDDRFELQIFQKLFIHGEVMTHTGNPVDGVTINITGDKAIEKVTDNTGAYSLSTFDRSTYTISASKSEERILNKKAVTTLDIVMSRRHLLQINEFTSPYQWIAADVNGSKSITALDIMEMRKVVLGLQDGFQSGLDWIFIPEAYDLSKNPFNYKTTMDITLEDEDINMNFGAVKVGDINNSWTTTGNARTTVEGLEISLENLSMEGQIIEIPLVAKDFNDISGYQFSITWDPNQLEYYGLEHQVLEGHFNEQMVNQGILTTMWDENSGKSIDLENGSVLFMLKFTARNEDAISAVELNSTLTEAVAFDGKLNVMAINSTAAIVNLEELRNGRLELLQNVPNPFDFSTSISFNLPKPGKARLSIINLLGEIIYLHEKEYSPGVYTISWNKNQTTRTLAPGVYLYRLESNGEEVVKKMVIE